MIANLNLYKYFMAVMDERSITKAAQKMGVSQPTVTYNIKELEKDLQEKLFVVERYGIKPKQRAENLYHDLKPIYLQFNATVEKFIRSR